MKIETQADACAALAVLMAGADGRGTLEESAFLHDRVAGMSPFGGMDRDGFARLLSEAADWMWSSFPYEGDHLTEEGMGRVLDDICRVIEPGLRAGVLKMAVGLARADGVSPEERWLVERLCGGLGLDAGAADDLMAGA